MTVVLIDIDGDCFDDQVAEVAALTRGAHLILLSPPTSRPPGLTPAGVHVISADRDTLAASCNLALAQSGTPYVAFLPAGARPSPDWLEPAVAMLERAEGLSAVRYWLAGAPIKGVTVTGLPGNDLAEPRDGEETLPAALDASVVRVRHVRAVGGLAHLRDWHGLGINLGWRLWLGGGSVRWCADAAIEGVRSPEGDPAQQLEAAVASVQTCWEDERRILGLRTLERLFGERAVAAESKRWNRERDRAQGSRRRSDAELLRLFQAPDTQDPLSAGFRRARRILVVTDDVLSQAMAGPAIRAWHIADELSRDGHMVQLVTTTGICERSSGQFGVEAPTGARWAELEHWCEIVVHQGYALTKVQQLRNSTKVMVADAYDPIQLEVLELSKTTKEPGRTDAIEMAAKVLNDQLRRADFVLCASEKQRDLWLGTLASLGRVSAANYDADPTLHRLIDVVPFGLPADAPRATRSAIRGVVPNIHEGDRVVIWGGGLYNWFDPITLIEAINLLKNAIPTIRLFFMGGRHPNPLTPEMRTAADAHRLSESLGLTGIHVFFNEGWVDYERRQEYLLDADVGVSLHLDHIETAFSFRTRILDYIWAGLPIVATSGDAFADMIEREGLGIVVPPQNPEATASALRRILESPEMAGAFAGAAAGMRSRFAWPRALEPLIEFCREPEQAPDRIRPPGTPPNRGGLPAGFERVERLGKAAARRYRRGGIESVAEGVLNTVRRVSSRGAP